MCNPDIHSLKHSLNKWLFTIVLLASVFAFSGLGASPQAGPSPVQTTWIIRGVNPTVKGIQFSIPKQDFADCCNKYHAALFVAGLSQHHSKSAATRLKICNDFNLLNAHKMSAGLLKTIPQNGKAEPSVLA
ncbi:MAG TPA: hypothetical protein VFE53_13910 [Mucilaginibacter sp.]|jgi:hypothetical protein|nr:hypothetical protein [Mucilaginibacter sp.]